MPRRKSTPSKRPLGAPPPQGSAPKRPKRGKQQRPPFRRQLSERLPLCSVAAAAKDNDDEGGGQVDALRLQFPVDVRLAPSLAAVCGSESALQLQIDLTLVEHDQVTLHLRGQEHSDADAQVPLAELFPDTHGAWRPHVATLAERGLLSLHINAKREAEDDDDWAFNFVASVAWRKYMTHCSSRGLLPGSAAPRATPMRAMHHVMIWLLKKTHDAQRGLSEADASCRFRYWNEIEVPIYVMFLPPKETIADPVHGLSASVTHLWDLL
ncbi:E3 ubiquitin-protein ligase SHPRH [Phytophthora cinnamomi]|uniref:E3 ubiquitin-protein ligase SHPRH n=1 Tax=Phytophthora cinnamomi TaxID=4785 RepID=UPI00355A2610|nr:E3 ubiquitin-protein ligase SHPRH [Phytophthora cinnamomi]